MESGQVVLSLLVFALFLPDRNDRWPATEPRLLAVTGTDGGYGGRTVITSGVVVVGL